MLSSALYYATELSWRVIPLQYPIAGLCSCGDSGCRSPAKHPIGKLVPHGLTDATIEPDTIRQWWSKYPQANVGVITGTKILFLDFDDLTNVPADLAYLVDGNCKTPRATTGRGGKHVGFVCDKPGIRSRTNVWPKVDIRADGGYIVAPPSIHANGNEYHWDAELEPWDIEPAELPDALEEFLRASQQAATPPPTNTVSATLPADEAEAITVALACIPADDRDTWLRMGMALKSTGAGRQAYELWCEWSKTSVKFDGKDQWKTWNSLKELRMDGSEVAIASLFYVAAEHGYVAPLDAMPEPEPAYCPPLELVPEPEPEIEPIPDQLLQIPGLIGGVVDWINSTAIRPQPALALGATIAALSALFGRRYRSRTDLRTNLYILGVGETGCGKEHPRNCIKKLFVAANLAKWLGGEGFASSAGILTALSEDRSPSQVFQVDEFGDVLAALSDERSPPYVRAIKTELLRLYSSANTIYRGNEYADQKTRKRVDLAEPNLCLFGTTTPGTFFDATSSRQLIDGFLNRFVVFLAHDQLPVARSIDRDLDPPAALIEQLVTAEKRSDPANRPGSPLAGRSGDPAIGSGVRTIEQEDAATGFLESLTADTDERTRAMRRRQDPHADLWVRYAENVVKVALVRAAGCDPHKPELRLADVKWAAELVTWSNESLCRGASDRMADTGIERDIKRMKRLIRRAGQVGLTRNQLTRKTQWLGRKIRSEYLATLLESGEVAEQKAQIKGARSSATVFVAVVSQ